MSAVRSKRNKIAKSLVIQHDQSDCGVACLATLIKFYDGEQSIESLRELSGTSKEGTTLLGLYQAANQIGFDASGKSTDIESLIDYGRPVILHVLINNTTFHYVICFGYENQKFIIGDPSKGVLFLSKKELSEIWKNKVCLLLEKNKKEKNFEKQMESFNKLFSGLKTIFFIVGLCLLLTGIIGIGNVMLIIVKERIKEIGIRKAVGAKNKDILNMIIFESLTITLISGITGLCIGFLSLKTINLIISKFYEENIISELTFSLSDSILTMFILVFSGCLAGFIPAKNALKINPIQAINNE